MSKKTNEGIISLIPSLPDKIIASIAYKLKVPNFFTLPEYDGDFTLQSSPFEFFKTVWLFKFTELSEDETDSEDDSEDDTNSENLNEDSEDFRKFSVYLKPDKFEGTQLELHYRISLLNADDEEYKTDVNVIILKNGDEEKRLTSFKNKDHTHDKSCTLTLIAHLNVLKPAHVDVDQKPSTIYRGISSLCHDLKDMLLNGKDHNIVLNVNGINYNAHQDILRSRSDVFRSMLTHDMLEKNSGVINVPDCDPKSFEQLLHFIYTGKVEVINEDIMFGLYYAADKYNLAHLKEECGKFIKKSLNITNVCDALDLGIKHNDVDLRDCAINYFFENVDNILLTVEWQVFMKNNSTVANELFIKSLKPIRQLEI